MKNGDRNYEATREGAATKSTAAKKIWQWIKDWNPFQKLETNADIITAAKAGALASGYLGLSYVAQASLLYWGGNDTLGHTGTNFLRADIFLVVIAALLTWRILARQALWAAIITAIWFAWEMAAKVMALASGKERPNFFWALMLAAITIGAILGVRGSWKLRLIRRSAKGRAPSDPEISN